MGLSGIEKQGFLAPSAWTTHVVRQMTSLFVHQPDYSIQVKVLKLDAALEDAREEVRQGDAPRSGA